eukprot:gene23111-9455_t
MCKHRELAERGTLNILAQGTSMLMYKQHQIGMGHMYWKGVFEGAALLRWYCVENYFTTTGEEMLRFEMRWRMHHLHREIISRGAILRRFLPLAIKSLENFEVRARYRLRVAQLIC